jgi:hypothetical protein
MLSRQNVTACRRRTTAAKPRSPGCLNRSRTMRRRSLWRGSLMTSTTSFASFDSTGGSKPQPVSLTSSVRSASASEVQAPPRPGAPREGVRLSTRPLVAFSGSNLSFEICESGHDHRHWTGTAVTASRSVERFTPSFDSRESMLRAHAQLRTCAMLAVTCAHLTSVLTRCGKPRAFAASVFFGSAGRG